MLLRLRVTRFKSLEDVEVELKPLTVFFGPNATGKSNLLQTLDVLSQTASERTLADALARPERGYPAEFTTFPDGGLPALLASDEADFQIEADVDPGRGVVGHKGEALRYRVRIGVRPLSGEVRVLDEYLARLNRSRQPTGSPAIELVEGQLRLRRKGKPAHPREEAVGQNHTLVSDERLSGAYYNDLESMRRELMGWRSYYLDPGLAMRLDQPPQAVSDIGRWGESLVPFLNRLKNSAEHSTRYQAVVRALRSIIPSIGDLSVELDDRRGILDLRIVQDGVAFSSRVVSEGTLRVLALCAIVANPWGGGLVAFEEPENGVHPHRLEQIADLLEWLALEGGRQVIVTTHSPALAGAMILKQRQRPGQIGVMVCRKIRRATTIEPFDGLGGLFSDHEIREALSSPAEDGLFQAMMMRGWLDG